MKRIFSLALFASILFASIILSLTNCIVVGFNYEGSRREAVAGVGELERFVINVGAFSRISVEAFAEVYFHSALSDYVILEIQPNLREYFEIEVLNNELVVRSTRTITGRSTITPILTVSTPILDRVRISGAADFRAYDTITADSFAVNISGAGEITAKLEVDTLLADIVGAGRLNLTGTAHTTRLNVSGAGQMNALNLETHSAFVNLSGAGTISLNVSDFLNVNASGVGSIEYRGSPQTSLNSSGLVNVRRLD